jgi:hypothetical protein
MAGDAVVGALRVVLGMDTASFEDGAKKAGNQLEAFGSRVASVFAGTGLERLAERVLDGLVEKFKEVTLHALKFAEELGNTAQKVGVPVEELSKLSFAAGVSGTSMETLSRSLGFLSKNMLDATKGIGNAQQQFKDLGVQVTDSSGKLRPVSDVLFDISAKFSNSADGAIKTADAINLLSRGGKELIPFLNLGTDRLKEFAVIAERVGLVIKQETADQATKLNENLRILGKTTEGFGHLVLEGLLPALVRWSNDAVDTATHTDIIKQSADLVVSSIKTVIAWFAYEGVAAVELFKTLTELALAAKALGPSTLTVSEALEESAKHFKNAQDIAAGSGDKAQAAADKVTSSFEHLNVTVNRTKDNLNIGKTPFSAEMDKLALQADIIRGKFADLPTGFAQLAVNLKLTDEAGKNLGTTLDQLSAEQLKLAQGVATVLVAQASFDLLSPYQKYLITLQQIAIQHALVAGAAELSAQRQAIAAAKLAGVYAGAAANIVGSIGDSVQAFAGDSKKMVAIAQAIHAAQALIATFAAGAEALAAGIFPANLVAAAAVVAKGLAFVAAIKAVPFATGGSFKVGGGIGGVDTQLVQFKATPGELVDIRRPGQERTNGGDITIRGIGPDDFFTGRMLRGLVDALNAGDRDGYKLKFAER